MSAPATIFIPPSDLKPLYDGLQECRACALERDATKQDLVDTRAQLVALTRERDAAIKAAVEAGASEVRIIDIVDNELVHVRTKLGAWSGHVGYALDDATAMSQPEGFADANIMFFLLHELPHEVSG